MKEIILTRDQKNEDYTVTVDDGDSDFFEKYTYHVQVNLSGHAYIRRWVKVPGKKSYGYINLQWDVYKRHCGEIPKGMCIDHRNGDTLDNRFSNLRLATRKQNRHNSRGLAESSSKYKGVVKYQNNTFGVFIRYENKQRIICSGFQNEVEAAKLADKIYKSLYGEFAHLNFPQIKQAI